MKVVYLKKSSSKGYLRLGVEVDGDARSYTLSEREYRELSSLKCGDNLTRVELSALEECDMRYRALRFALSSLSLCDSSKRNLYMKLTARKISKEIAALTVNEVVRLGYLNEERQIENIAISLNEREKMGRYKITRRLLSKGYSQGDINRAICRLISEEKIDFEATRAELLAKYPDDLSDEEKRKILYKNGYVNV